MYSKQTINSLFTFIALCCMNSLFCSAAGGSAGDSKREKSPMANPTPPPTPSLSGSTPGMHSLLKLTGPVTTQHGLDPATNKSVSALAGAASEFAKSLQGGNPENIPTISAAITKAAAAIENPGTIGFAANKETVEAISHIRSAAAHINQLPKNMAAAFVTSAASVSILCCGPNRFNSVLLWGGVEYLEPGTTRACLNQTKQCLRDAHANYELTSQCPFIKQKSKPANASMARDQSAGGASGGVKKDN